MIGEGVYQILCRPKDPAALKKEIPIYKREPGRVVEIDGSAWITYGAPNDPVYSRMTWEKATEDAKTNNTHNWAYEYIVRRVG